MFGYIRYDLPNLYIKDLTLYKSAYCGLCKGIAASCGQRARFALTYDLTFLSVLLHNMTGTDFKIEKQNCFEHCVRKRPIADADELTCEIGALNTVLAYYKLTDDILDKNRGRGKRAFFQKGFKRAKKKYPALVEIVDGYMRQQARVEGEKTPSPDAAADPSACMTQALGRHFLKEHANEATDALFYAIGKWVYLIDALDDYDKDHKKKEYNPFVLSYGNASRQELMEQNGEDVKFLFDTIFYTVRESLGKISFPYNHDLTDNILLLGLPKETERIMKGEAIKKMSAKA